jgi:cell wall-associated NlpC family hydrolase
MSYGVTGTSADRPGHGRGMLPRMAVRAAPILVITAAAALGSAGFASAASGPQPSARHGAGARMLLGQRIAADARAYVGRYPYKWGGNSPQTGFDCSGLTSYIYRHHGKAIPRTAEAQYTVFRKVRNGKAWRGDLVFFHDGSGHVYHVGIYEGGGMLVSAADPQDGIMYETVWASTVTFGTITH